MMLFQLASMVVALELSNAGDSVRAIPLVDHGHIVTALAFSPDGKLLASGDWENDTVVIWSVPERKVISRLVGLSPRVDPVTKFKFPYFPERLEFTRDGKMVVASNHRFVAGWNPSKSTKLFGRVLDDREQLIALCVAPSGKSMIASICTDATPPKSELRELSPAAGNGNLRKRFNGDDYATTCSLAANGKTLFFWKATAALKGDEIQKPGRGAVCEFPNMKRKAQLLGKKLAPPHLSCFCLDDRFIATGSYDGLVVIWDARTGEEVDRHVPDESWITGLCYNAKHKMLMASTENGVIWLYDMVARKCVRNRKIKDVSALALSPDGTMVAIGFGNGQSRHYYDPLNQGLLFLCEFENLLK